MILIRSLYKRINLRRRFPAPIIFLLIFISANSCIAQKADSNFVKKYSKENDVEIFSDWQSCKFHFISSRHALKKDFSLVSNSMLYTGVNIDYKWLSIGYGINVPGTAKDNSNSQKDLLLQLNDINHLIIWQAYFKKYNGLLSRVNNRDDYFNKYNGVHISDVGGSILYPLNHKTFSYNAARYLNQQQLRSSGSIIFTFSPFYHQVKNKDSIPEAKDKKAIHFLRSSPQWLSSTLSIGYAYNFLGHQNKWNLSPELNVGYGVSRFLKPNAQWKRVLEYNAVVTFGYSSKLFYAYLTGFYHDFKNHFTQERVAETNSGGSFTCGYRIGSLKKKIFHLL